MRGLTCRLATQVPSAVEEFPRNLKRDECFACAGSKREQDALPIFGDSLHYSFYSSVLVVPAGMGATLVFKRHGGESIAPCVLFGKHSGPEFIRSRIFLDIALGAFNNICTIDCLTVG